MDQVNSDELLVSHNISNHRNEGQALEQLSKKFKLSKNKRMKF